MNLANSGNQVTYVVSIFNKVYSNAFYHTCSYWLFDGARAHATNWHCYITARVTDKFLRILCKFTLCCAKGILRSKHCYTISLT